MPASSTMPAGQAFGSAVGVTRHHVENAHEIRLGVRMTPLAKQEVHAASHPFWAKPGVIRGIEDDVVRGFFDRHPGFKPKTRFAAKRFQIGLEHRSEEHTSELQSLMRISYAVFCLKKTKKTGY